ncbi:helix-turn-helix domain-containing protein [Angustibacter peucedani]
MAQQVEPVDRPGRREPEHAAPQCDASLSLAFGLLGKRWNGIILGVLAGGPGGFADVRRAIGTITDSVLSDRLSELAAAGLVERSVTDSRPPGVRYGLTPAGERLVPILDELAGWAAQELDPGRC